MKQLFSTRINNGSFNTAMLLIRIIAGGLMLHHGYSKIEGFNSMKESFMNFLHLGSQVTLCLVIFAEFFCAALLILGLFTRVAAFVLLINMAVIIFMVFNMDFYGKAELACLYTACYLSLLLCGPGKISIDSMISKN